MLSIHKTRKKIELTKYLCTIENHQIRWRQLISKKGKVQGIGSFLRLKSQGSGNWSKTLQSRIKARREKGKDWAGGIKEK